MQTLNLHRPDMPNLQFVLLVTALCTSRLSSLNISHELRTAVFDRCWMLIHDSPPPRNPEERVLDLRPWTELTVEAMVETIRVMLSEAGIETLAWDRPSSEPKRTSMPEADILIDRLEHLYPHLTRVKETATAETFEITGVRPDENGEELWQLIGRIATLMAAVAPALKRRAAGLETGGKSGEVVDKLLKAADVMHGSGTIYLSWARHYAGLSENMAKTEED